MSGRRQRKTSARDSSGRIAGIEVVSYTAVLLLIAAVAAGYFDAMVPWK